MDFLTTNFPEDTTSRFTAPFRLQDLPLEILFKILVFLDDPELASLSQTCHFFRSLARERFIMRSRFFYVRDRIGIRLSAGRPALNQLYEQHIIPVPNVQLLGNPAHLEVVNDLQRSFRRDSLSKELQRRPEFSELKQKNIIPPDCSTSPLVKTRVKELKQENLSQMLQVLMRSYKFQKKLSSPAEITSKSTTSPITEEEHKALINKIDAIEKRAKKDPQSASVYNDVSDEFVQIYNKLCARFGHTLKLPKQRAASTPVPPSTPSRRPAELNILNHVDPTPIRTVSAAEPSTSSTRTRTPETPQPQSRISSTSSCFSHTSPETDPEDLTPPPPKAPSVEMTSVRSKKQYFEQLHQSLNEGEPQKIDPFLRSVSEGEETMRRKPSRTVLRASVINDCIISYEKLF